MSFPDNSFWWNLAGTLGIEVCVVVALGVAAQCAFRRAYWQRAMWQMTLICLILVSASEWTGFGRGAAWYFTGQERIKHVEVPIKFPPGLPYFVLKNATISAPATLPLPQKKAVWWPGWVWLVGTLFVLGRMATAQCLLLVLRFRREKIVDDILQERVARVAKMVGLRRKICLLRLPQSISPMAFGILFPTIGLPPGFETGFSAVEKDAILAHELAHLAVLDPLWFRLADFASALLWWHPLAWWARRSLHGASELAADEATALVADGPGSLANCLVGLGKKMTLGHGWGWVGINGEFRSKLGKRVERLTRMPGKAGRPFVSWSDTVTRIAVAILIVPIAVLLLFAAFQTAHGDVENGWRESWDSSPVGLLAMAAADEAQQQKPDEHTRTDKADIAHRVQDAKVLYEMGKLKESQAILKQVLKEDPSNRTAAYYLDMIKDAQFINRQRKKGPTEIPLATNDFAETSTLGDPHENVTTNKAPIATRIMDAKLLFEMGKLEASKAILNQVMQDEPTNKTAPYFLNLIKEAEFMDRARKREAAARSAILGDEQDNQTIPNPIVTNGLVYTTRGRQAILSKLDRIRLDEVQYDLPLTEVLNRLRIESQKRDPERVGINFLFNPHLDAVASSFLGYDATGTAPAGAIAIVAPHPSVDLSSVNIKISPALIDVRLADVLNAITMVADQPITYAIEDYAVVFSPKPAEAILLYSKTYHFDPNSFIKSIMAVMGTNSGNPGPDIDKPTKEKPGNDGIRGAGDEHDSFGGQSGAGSSVGLNFVTRTNNTVQLDTILRSYFTAAGVDLTDPGKSVFFNDRLGLLLVRATAEDLQLIDAAIGALNQSPPKTVPKPTKSDALLTKAFQLNPILFKETLLGAVGSVPGSDTKGTNDTEQFKQSLLTYFAKAGAKITAPEEIVIYDGSLRVLVVRATQEKLQIIEQALGPLTKVPPQVTISADFVELSQKDARELGFENFLQTKEANFTSVLSPSQYQTVIRNIKQNTHEEIVSMPRITTLSGRQLHAASQDLRDNVLVGPAYDMIPTVLENGYSIKTVLIPTYTEFLQYDPPGTFASSASASSGAPVAATLPLPHFRTRQVVSTRNIRDGQTVVAGQWVSDKPSEPKRLQLYFVTPRIIDPAGNPVNSDKELSEKP